MILGLYTKKEVEEREQILNKAVLLVKEDTKVLENLLKISYRSNEVAIKEKNKSIDMLRKRITKKEEEDLRNEIKTLKGLLERSEDYTINKLEHAKKRTKKTRIKTKIDNKIADHVMRKEIYGR